MNLFMTLFMQETRRCDLWSATTRCCSY